MQNIRKLKRLLLVCAVAVFCLSSCSGSTEENTFVQMHNMPSVNQTSASAPPVSPTLFPTPSVSQPITQTLSETPLILVNSRNPIPEDYAVAVRELPNQQKVAAVCYDDLIIMLSDCKAAGLNPEVCSGYRTLNDQSALFNNKVSRVMEQGYNRQAAELLASTEVAYPGTSEHHTGLAVDIVDKDYPVLDKTQEDRLTQQWLLENSWKYGFILRYPADKTSLTGIIYEPWHYRYVGREVAQEIHERGICLEEYLQF